MTFAVSLSATSSRDVTVTYTLGGSAGSPADYTAPTPLSVTIAAGSTSGTITVPVKGDTIDELDETIEVTLSGATNAGLSATEGATEASGSITDDDATPTVSVTDAAAVSEGDDPSKTTDMTFAVSLSATSSRDVTVTYTLGGSAGSPADYTAPTPLSVTIAAGSTSGTITVPVKGDTIDELDETIEVTLSGATNAGLSATEGATEASGSITDDDATPTVSVTDAAAVSEGDDPSKTTDMTFAVSLSATSSRDVTVTYTLGGSAGSPADYTAPTPLSVTIAAGSTSGTITVPVKGDTIDELDETIEVTLSGATNAGLSATEGATEASGSITDDDATPTVSVTDAAAVSEGDDPSKTTDMTFAVSLSATSSRDVTVTYTLGGSAGSPADYTAPTPLSVTIAAGSTGFNITIPAGESGTITVGHQNHGPITDDDATPTVSVTDAAAVSEGDDPSKTTDRRSLCG